MYVENNINVKLTNQQQTDFVELQVSLSNIPVYGSYKATVFAILVLPAAIPPSFDVGRTFVMLLSAIL